MKHLGQKYMGIRPSQHEEEMFKTQEFDAEGGKGGHLVPINVSCSLLGCCCYKELIGFSEFPQCTMSVTINPTGMLFCS